MEVEWLQATPVDADGERYTVHYLVDRNSQLCYATICEPRFGHLLFVTDLRVAGVDRSYLTLEAAKAHCEWSAFKYDDEEAGKLAEVTREKQAPTAGGNPQRAATPGRHETE